MKPQQIRVGATYRNKDAGRTTRTVLEISDTLPAPWYSDRPKETVVRFIQRGRESTMYLSSFAAWCGSEVEDE